jgi:hypothetical protein
VDDGVGIVELKRRETPLRAGRSRWRGRAEEDEPAGRSTGGRRWPRFCLCWERDARETEKMRLANCIETARGDTEIRIRLYFY